MIDEQNADYDALVDDSYPVESCSDSAFWTVMYSIGLRPIKQAQAEDLMDVGIREDINVELILDCDSREDFLQLRSLERTIENFEKGEYL